MSALNFPLRLRQLQQSRTILHTRSTLLVVGRDSTKFLHDLSTSDFKRSSLPNKPFLTSFLATNGRLISQALVIQPDEKEKRFLLDNISTNTASKQSIFPSTSAFSESEFTFPSFILDVPTGSLSSLQKHINKFKLRSKVKFFDLSAAFQVVSFLSAAMHMDILQENGKSALIYQDPRSDKMGLRALFPLHNSNWKAFDCFEEISEDLFNYYRYLHGLSEDFCEDENGIPLEHNLEILNGVSFDKGCYIGQELTTRSFFVGKIRKRVLPFLLLYKKEADDALKINHELLDNKRTSLFPPSLFNQSHNDLSLPVISNQISAPDDKEDNGVSLVTSKGKKVGKILGHVGNAGIALMRLGDIQEPLGVKDLARDDVVVKYLRPHWMEEKYLL